MVVKEFMGNWITFLLLLFLAEICIKFWMRMRSTSPSTFTLAEVRPQKPCMLATSSPSSSPSEFSFHRAVKIKAGLSYWTTNTLDKVKLVKNREKISVESVRDHPKLWPTYLKILYWFQVTTETYFLVADGCRMCLTSLWWSRWLMMRSTCGRI